MKSGITCAKYFLHLKGEKIKDNRLELDASTLVSTFCPQCGAEHGTEFINFLHTMEHDDFFRPTLCDTCWKGHEKND